MEEKIEEEPKKKFKLDKKILGIVGVIVLVIILIVGGFFVLRAGGSFNSNDDSKKSSSICLAIFLIAKSISSEEINGSKVLS